MVAPLAGQRQQHQLLGQHVQNQEIKEGSWGRLKAGRIGGGIGSASGWYCRLCDAAGERN